MASKGYVSVTVEYRLSGEAAFPAAVQDIKAAVRFLRANAAEYGIDAEAIGICGGSAGGHLSLLTGFSNGVAEFEGEGGNSKESSAIQGVVSMYGGTDFCAPVVTGRGMNTGSAQWLAVPFREDPGRYVLASPIHHVNKARAELVPPTMFVTPFPEEPWSNVEGSASWLERWGIENEVKEVRGPHGFIYMTPFQDEVLEMVDEFFGRVFGKE